MRVLLISQHFHPETGATQNRLTAMAEAFVQRGDEVHVVAAKPNHPEGKIWPEYEKGMFVKRQERGASVVHCWLYTRPAKSVGNRTLSYLSFMVSAILAGFVLPSRFDVVVGSSPPPFLGISAWVLARWKGAKFVFDVRDLWPGLAVALGELKNPAAIWLAERLERFLYGRADRIAAVTEPFVREIRQVVGGSKPVELVMNGTTPEFFEQSEERERVRGEHGWEGEFVVMYAGNVGVCQGLNHIIEAAKATEAAGAKVRFVVVGEGPRKARLRAEAERVNCRSLEFLPRVNLSEAIRLMSGADALLVPLANSEMCEQFIPSKLFDSMACGKPVLLSVNGEARRVMTEAGGGLYYPAESAEGLTESVRWLMEHRSEARLMGEHGRSYVAARCLRSQQMAKLCELAGRGRNEMEGLECRQSA